MVLDHRTLSLCASFRRVLQKYGDDQQDYYHVGLVTAGGSESDDEKKTLQEVFKDKYNNSCNYRIWKVPGNRLTYKNTVTSVVTLLEQNVTQKGPTSESYSSSPVPPLFTP